MSLRRSLPHVVLLAIVVTATFLSAQGGGRQGGAAAPRARSVTLGDLTAFDVKENVITVSAGPDQIRIIYYRDDIFRLWLGPDGQFTEAQPTTTDAQIVIGTFAGVNPVAVKTRDVGEYYRLDSASSVLRVYKRPLKFALFDKNNATVIWQETKPLTYGPSTIQTLKRGDNENFFGGGMTNGYFSHRDTIVPIRLNTRGWNDGATPNPAPFYMSTAGYGVLRNTMTPGSYDFHAPLALSQDESRFDAYYFVGTDAANPLKQVLDDYTLVTGRPFMMPRWGLGFGDADCYNKTGKTIDVVERIARKYRENDMPGQWILPNDGYGCGYTDLPGTITELKQLGFLGGLWTENGLAKIATEVRDMGSRAMKLDVAWVGRGYQFALNGMRDAYEGLEKNADSRGFVWTTCAWAGGQRYAVIWSGDQSGNWEYIRFHIPTIIGAGLSGYNAATGDVDGIFGGSAQTQVRDLQWKALTPAWMIISGWSKQTNNMKQPWIFGEPYTTINRKYMKLKARLTPYMYTLSREAYDTGTPTNRAMVLEFPNDPTTWSKRTQYQFMTGESILVAPVYEDTTVRNDIYLPNGRWIDYWDGTEFNGSTTLNNYAAPLEKLPMFIKAGAIIPLGPEMLYDGQKPMDPITFDVYPSGKSSFTLYEDDGSTQRYRTGAAARTRIDMESPVTPDSAGDQITLKVGAVKGTYDGMPVQRGYGIDMHVTAKPAKVTIAGKALNEIVAPAGTAARQALDKIKADFAAATEGWYYDATDRKGVLHVKIAPQKLATGFTAVVGL